MCLRVGLVSHIVNMMNFDIIEANTQSILAVGEHTLCCDSSCECLTVKVMACQLSPVRAGHCILG